MSLYSSIQMAGNALQAQQYGLQVVGNNISNVNTPGYSRGEAVLEAGPTAQDGTLLEGTGVVVQGTIQVADKYLQNQLLGANSDQANAQSQATTYQNLETSLNALGGNASIAGSLNQFIASITNVLNSPQDPSMRNLAVSQGQTLASTLNSLNSQISQQRSALDSQVTDGVSNANALITQISGLNTQIVSAEGGNSSGNQAVGLRNQRDEALDQLSQLIGIKVENQSDGSVNIYSGGDFLVFGNQTQQLKTVQQVVDGQPVSQVVLAGTGSPLPVQSGSLSGTVAARDQILGGFQEQLNQFAGTLAFEFNKAYSQGQGTTGYQTVTSTYPVSDSTSALENAGLTFTPVNGSFQVQVTNSQTNQTQTTTIPVTLNGLSTSETTLSSLAQSLNGVSGLSASIDTDGYLSISTTSPNVSFSFANDTSGTLAALGINTFFTGSTAGDLSVNQQLVADPSKFAASQGGVGADTNNAVQLAGFLDQPLDSLDGGTINQLNTQITTNVTQNSANAQATAQGLTSYQSTLQGQQASISGVNIDEEAVTMMAYQNAYVASAKFISTLSTLLQTLVQL